VTETAGAGVAVAAAGAGVSAAGAGVVAAAAAGVVDVEAGAGLAFELLINVKNYEFYRNLIFKFSKRLN
jgi:hypothetical protein